MTLPDAVVKTFDSPKGPQVGRARRYLAHLAEAETQSRVAGVGLEQGQQVMRLAAHVAGRHDRAAAKLTLNAKEYTGPYTGVTLSGLYPGRPDTGRNGAQFTLESGLLADGVQRRKWMGKRCPLSKPVEAVMNGSANSGGAGLE